MQNSAELLRRLVAADADFVVIGGVAAIMHGSASLTHDVDVMIPFTEANLESVLAALHGQRLRYALTPDKRPIVQSASVLATYRNLYVLTDIGRIDFLGECPAGTFEEIARRADTKTVFDMPCRVMCLDDLIAVKAALGRPKDKIVEMELRAIRDRLRSR